MNALKTRLLAVMALLSPTISVESGPPPLIKMEQLPLVYPILSGYDSVSKSRSASADNTVYALELLVAQMSTTYRQEAVAESIAKCEECIDAIIGLFKDHRFLSTDTLEPLPTVSSPITIQSQGVVIPLTGPDRNPYIGSIIEIRIPTTENIHE